MILPRAQPHKQPAISAGSAGESKSATADNAAARAAARAVKWCSSTSSEQAAALAAGDQPRSRAAAAAAAAARNAGSDGRAANVHCERGSTAARADEHCADDAVLLSFFCFIGAARPLYFVHIFALRVGSRCAETAATCTPGAGPHLSCCLSLSRRVWAAGGRQGPGRGPSRSRRRARSACRPAPRRDAGPPHRRPCLKTMQWPTPRA